MPTRWKNVPGISMVAIGLMLGLIVGTFSAVAQDAATPQVLPGATPGATPALVDQPVDIQYPVGAIISTTTENLRLRTEPSTDSESLTSLPQGSQLQVISGPEEAEGFTWYEVEVLDTDESVSGWVATSADFVDAVEGTD